LEKYWNEHKDRPKNALFHALIRAYKGDFLIALSLNLLAVVFEIANPLLIKLIIDSFQDPLVSTFTISIFALLYVLANILFNLCSEQANFYQMQFGVKAQTAVRGLIYEKILRISPATNKEFKQGDITNFIQVDAKQIINLA
jgi:ABC-type multidrug transport system fused ATPase/permease subunit